MERNKSNTPSQLHLYLALFLLVACIILVFGSVYARYRSDFFENPIYVSKDGAKVKLWSVTDDGEFDAKTASWTDLGEGKSLLFGVTNGEPNDYAAESQHVRIRLLGTVGISYSDAMHMELYVSYPDTGDSAVYDAVATQILPDTPLYHKFGAGWLFTFTDDYGEEVAISLPGGVFSAITAEVTAWGMETNDVTLLQLQIVADVSGE